MNRQNLDILLNAKSELIEIIEDLKKLQVDQDDSFDKQHLKNTTKFFEWYYNDGHHDYKEFSSFKFLEDYFERTFVAYDNYFEERNAPLRKTFFSDGVSKRRAMLNNLFNKSILASDKLFTSIDMFIHNVERSKIIEKATGDFVKETKSAIETDINIAKPTPNTIAPVQSSEGIVEQVQTSKLTSFENTNRGVQTEVKDSSLEQQQDSSESDISDSLELNNPFSAKKLTETTSELSAKAQETSLSDKEVISTQMENQAQESLETQQTETVENLSDALVDIEAKEEEVNTEDVASDVDNKEVTSTDERISSEVESQEQEGKERLETQQTDTVENLSDVLVDAEAKEEIEAVNAKEVASGADNQETVSADERVASEVESQEQDNQESLETQQTETVENLSDALVDAKDKEEVEQENPEDVLTEVKDFSKDEVVAKETSVKTSLEASNPFHVEETVSDTSLVLENQEKTSEVLQDTAASIEAEQEGNNSEDIASETQTAQDDSAQIEISDEDFADIKQKTTKKFNIAELEGPGKFDAPIDLAMFDVSGQEPDPVVSLETNTSEVTVEASDVEERAVIEGAKEDEMLSDVQQETNQYIDKQLVQEPVFELRDKIQTAFKERLQSLL